MIAAELFGAMGVQTWGRGFDLLSDILTISNGRTDREMEPTTAGDTGTVVFVARTAANDRLWRSEASIRRFRPTISRYEILSLFASRTFQFLHRPFDVPTQSFDCTIHVAPSILAPDAVKDSSIGRDSQLLWS